MSAQKRKRTDFTLLEKKEIIDAAEKEPNQSKLAREISKKWGIEVKRTTVKGILSKKDAIEAAIIAGVPAKRMKLKQANNPKHDEGVLMWLKQARRQNLPVSGDLIKEKALKLADLMHIPGFMVSNGWLDNFKKRHGITFKTVQGEAEAVDSQSLPEWQQRALPAEEKMHENGEIELSDFLEADERLATGRSFTLEEIAEEMLCSEETVKSEDDDITVEEEVVSFEEAQHAWSTVRKFMEQRSGKPGVMQACNRLDNEMYVVRPKMSQPTILDRFGLKMQMESHSQIPSGDIKLEPDLEMECVESSDEETVTEGQLCDDIGSEITTVVKIEQPEVSSDYLEMPPSSGIDPHLSSNNHSQNELYDDINSELVKQELPETLCEGNNQRFSTMGDMASCSLQDSTGYSSAESSVTENSCQVSFYPENCCQMSENMSAAIKISNSLFLNKKNRQQQNTEKDLNLTVSRKSFGLNAVFADGVSPELQAGDEFSMCEPAVSGDTHLNKCKETLAGEKPYKCDVCCVSFAKSGHLKCHKRKHTGEKPYKCDVCNASFAQTSNLNRHKRIHTGEKPYKCVICGSSFTQPGNLRIHERIHTGEKRYKCEDCGDSFMKARTLKNHKKTHNPEENSYQCDVCDASFEDSSILKLHKRKHAVDKPFKCDECDVYFARADHLKSHRVTHTGEKLYKCDDCGASFKHATTLTCHKRKHTGEKPYVCNECGASFTQARMLNRHKIRHTGEKPFKCDQCDTTFICFHNLKNHMKIHSGEKPHKCDFCGACFVESSALKGHERIHTGEKPYRCDDCSACFATSSGLISHRRKHTGERPYKCDVCDASFSESGTLKSHKRIHTGEKPYRCDVCGVSFAQITSLTGHKRTHTGEKPYKCDVCGTSYARSNNLKLHKETCRKVGSDVECS